MQKSIQTSSSIAQVAELVDALASGASIGNSMEVRVLSWAPLVIKKLNENSALKVNAVHIFLK